MDLKLPQKTKLFEAFAGIGTQRMAFERLNIPYEMVGISEIDKYAIQSYNAIHGETKNYGDITQIQELPEIDVFTWSFPCQDLSVAGKREGLYNGERSGLAWEVIKLLSRSENKPKILIMENVAALLYKTNIDGFNELKEQLSVLGYTNHVFKMNAKDYGVAQNRDRVFMISHLGEYTYDPPTPFKLTKRLVDYLEDNVDEKYYLSDKQINRIRTTTYNVGKTRIQEKDYCDTLCARDYKDPKVVRVGGMFDKDDKTHQAGSIYSPEGVSPTLNTSQGGYRQPSIIINEATEQKTSGNAPSLTSAMGMGGGHTPMITEPSIAASRGRKPDNPSDRTAGSPTEQRLEINKNGTSNTITTVQKDNYVLEPKTEFGRMGRQATEAFNELKPKHGETLNPFNKSQSSKDGVIPTITTIPDGFKTAISVSDNFRIRKLTPLECWRLMGIDDKDFTKAQQSGVSNSQLYKQAGNAIVVDVFVNILNTLI